MSLKVLYNPTYRLGVSSASAASNRISLTNPMSIRANLAQTPCQIGIQEIESKFNKFKSNRNFKNWAKNLIGVYLERKFSIYIQQLKIKGELLKRIRKEILLKKEKIFIDHDLGDQCQSKSPYYSRVLMLWLW